MAFVLVRIDDRLIHGQVTVAWGTWLEPDRIILVSDDVALTEWKRELYSSTDTLGSSISILSKVDFLRGVNEDRWSEERALVIVESPADLLELINGGLKISCANVGGMHFAQGKREILPYVYVDEEDVQAMRQITSAGVKLEARDVPQSTPIDLGPSLDAFPENCN